jgi:glutamate-1-semialdehyde 2,1-aminomutase
MSMVAPAGPMYQAGTLSGNPLAMAAGITTLRELAEPGRWQAAEARAAQLEEALTSAAKRANVPALVQRVGTMFTTFFTSLPAVTNWQDAKTSDTSRFGSFFRSMLDHGVYLAPSQFEAAFTSTAHTSEDIEETASACYSALASA